MKKWKELLWFLVPFVLLPVFAAIATYFSWVNGTPQFIIGREHYLELLWEDPAFWMGVFNALLSCWLMGAVLALVLGLAVRWLPLSRRLKYGLIFMVALLIAAVVWTVGMQMIPRWYSLLLFLQIGNAAAFVAWLAECIWTAVRKPKQECEVS